jgi:hypothetical protein
VSPSCQDTAILVKLLVREPDFYAALVYGQPAWSSQLVLVECFSTLRRKEREWAIDRAAATKLGLPLAPVP